MDTVVTFVRILIAGFPGVLFAVLCATGICYVGALMYRCFSAPLLDTSPLPSKKQS
jgi:hypothetical protein